MKPLLIVDGYNVLLATDTYEAYYENPDVLSFAEKDHDPYHLHTDPLARAREVLMADIQSFVRDTYETVVVFDGTKNQNRDRKANKLAGLTYLFSDTGTSADEMIADLTTKSLKIGRKVTVITSDLTIQATVKGLGALTLSSQMFLDRLSGNKQGMQDYHHDSPATHATIEDVLDQETITRLRNIT